MSESLKRANSSVFNTKLLLHVLIIVLKHHKVLIHVWLLLFCLQLGTCCELFKLTLLCSVSLSFLHNISNCIWLITACSCLLECFCDYFSPNLFMVVFMLLILVNLIISGWATVHLTQEPLRCPIESMVWYECFYKYILLPARIYWANAMLSICSLMVWSQVTL